MSLYILLRDAGCEIDSHESDLYVRATPEARRIVKEQCGERLVYLAFQSTADRSWWIEVPFAFDPWWEAKGMM